MPHPPPLILSADCGGTNTRLSLYSIPISSLSTTTSSLPGTLLLHHSYLNETYSLKGLGFNDILKAFFDEAKSVLIKDGNGKLSGVSNGGKPTVAVMACAGPVCQNRVLFTNNGWLIDGNQVTFGLGGFERTRYSH
jgi:glucokinase